jgi:shikimate dehydrogenase
MLVVTLPPSAANDPEAYARKAKAAGADVLEIRGDRTPHITSFECPLPLLISPRGNREILSRFSNPAHVDLELHEEADIAPTTILIRSFHDFHGTPPLAALRQIAEQLMETKPAIIKIATLIGSYEDLRMLRDLDESLPPELMRVLLGMGPKAFLNRLLSRIEYTYLDDGEEAAPGQLPISLHRLTQHCKKPLLMGILGGPQVTKSLSPLIHNTLMHHAGFDGLYAAFPTDDLDDAWNNLTTLDVTRFSVTAPWKQEIIEKLDRLDPLAQELGSVNTVVSEKEGWTGYNTDVVGFRDAYKFLKGACTIAILGSGGVVPAVIKACRELDAGSITVYARNEEERQAIAKKFDVDAKPLPKVLPEYEAVICTISADIGIELPKTTKRGGAIDLRYGQQTKFLKEAKAKGYETHDGLPMLLLQALKQFQLFTGKNPSDESIATVNETILDSSASIDAKPQAGTPAR